MTQAAIAVCVHKPYPVGFDCAQQGAYAADIFPWAAPAEPGERLQNHGNFLVLCPLSQHTFLSGEQVGSISLMVQMRH
jgi:hypothetical protein